MTAQLRTAFSHQVETQVHWNTTSRHPGVLEHDCTAQGFLLMPGRPSVANTAASLVEALHTTGTLEHISGPLPHQSSSGTTFLDSFTSVCTATCHQTAHNITSDYKTLLLFKTFIKQATSSIITTPACCFMGEHCVLALFYFVGLLKVACCVSAGSSHTATTDISCLAWAIHWLIVLHSNIP